MAASQHAYRKGLGCTDALLTISHYLEKSLAAWMESYGVLCRDGVLCCPPPDRPAVAASLNRDLSRIQEWYNYRCLIPNPNKTKALVVGRSRSVNPPHGDLVLSGVSIRAGISIPYHTIISIFLA